MKKISIKRQVSQINSNTNDRVESLCDSTLKLDNDIAKYSETLLKKVQSVHHFHGKGHTFSRTETETPNIIPLFTDLGIQNSMTVMNKLPQMLRPRTIKNPILSFSGT
jgi:hypothetical protein